MSIKSILAPVTGHEKGDEALVAGLDLARRLGAFVEVLHVKLDPRDAIPLVTEGAAGSVVTRIMEIAEKEADARALVAERLFESACRAAKVISSGASAGARLTTVVGRAPDEVSLRARVVDLVLMGRVPEDSEVDWRLTLEAAIMETGRPVLLLPAGVRAGFGKTVAIAWNGSVEAARAASASLPFLCQAERVLLLSGAGGEPVRPSLDAVAAWLSRHGIKGEQRRVVLKGWPVGEQLIDEATAAGADLVVMGGYGHSRLRETIFGGATRAVLNGARLPVLLAH